MRALAINLNLIWVLTWMQFVPRSRRETAKLFWVIMEPAGMLAIMMLIFSLIGRVPGYGDSFGFFLMTGIVMMTLYMTGSTMVMNGVLIASQKMRLPMVGIFHEAIARLNFKVLVALCYTALLAWGIGLLDQNVDPFPPHLFRTLGAFFWCGLLAFGMGLCLAYITHFAPSVAKVYNVLSRALIFISGIFYVPSFMPPQLRDLLFYNPLLHCVEALRLGMYLEYPTTVYSPLYMQLWALGSIALGATLIWQARREILLQ